jgi:hypothetical protein
LTKKSRYGGGDDDYDGWLGTKMKTWRSGSGWTTTRWSGRRGGVVAGAARCGAWITKRSGDVMERTGKERGGAAAAWWKGRGGGDRRDEKGKGTGRRRQESRGGEGSPRGKRLDRVGESVVAGSQMVGEIEPG